MPHCILNIMLFYFSSGTITEISTHSFRLAQSVFQQLAQWHHSNGQPLAILYHEGRQFDYVETQGPIVNFNLLRPDGSFVGFVQAGVRLVERVIAHPMEERLVLTLGVESLVLLPSCAILCFNSVSLRWWAS